MKIKMIVSFILLLTVSAISAVTVSASPPSPLPDVGGIGTTVFYVVGGILIVLAIVLILTKARMGKDK